jgi:death-on-curing protein
VVPLWVPTLDDFVGAAAIILETPEETIRRLPRLHLVESALAAPFAGFGETEAYPDLVDKAAVLIERIARNHPLPDGNKRAALAITILFLERNGRYWGEPDTDRDARMVERIAAGAVEFEALRAWIGDRSSS